MRLSLFLLVTLIGTSRVFSQIQDSSRTPNPNPIPIASLQSGFAQNLNTLDWNGVAAGDWSTSNYLISVNENFHSVMIKQQQNLIRDEQNFDGDIARSIFGNLFAFGGVQSNYVSDNREIGLNSVGTSKILGGLLLDTPKDSLFGAIGNKWDQQAGVNNSGFIYSLYANDIWLPAEESKLIDTVTWQEEQISPRRNFDKLASITYYQSFSPQSSLRFAGSYGSQLRDFYFPADSSVQTTYGVKNNIQDRTDNQGSFLGELSVPILFFQLNARSSYGQREIQYTYRYKPTNDPANNLYDTRIKVSDFNLSGQMIAEIFADTLILNMAHTERSETHSVVNLSSLGPFTQQQMSTQSQLDNLGTRNVLSGQLFLHFGNTTANLTGLASLFRYDTPSELNYDDRDELTNTIAFVLSHPFSPFFQAGFGIEADMIHIVYIESERSANNNRNFIYKFFPIIAYSNQRISSFNRFEVLANYTVYDFEAFSQIHSFSFRQASFLDSTTIRMTSRISTFLLANIKLYTRGELYWSSFSEYPLNYFVDETFWVSLFFTTSNIRYGVGYKYLSLAQYNYLTAKARQFATQQTNAGPTAIISLSLSHLQIRVDGWYQVSRQTLQNPIVYPNFELTAQYNI